MYQESQRLTCLQDFVAPYCMPAFTFREPGPPLCWGDASSKLCCLAGFQVTAPVSINSHPCTYSSGGHPVQSWHLICSYFTSQVTLDSQRSGKQGRHDPEAGGGVDCVKCTQRTPGQDLSGHTGPPRAVDSEKCSGLSPPLC